ncbi:unnamed protein product [Heligmosomoides polygyrus]|uniref:Receptor expression-enhancing protein n=1 Tax=Heligmosomoides polygyrus TaxID=6339 RepID=A0A183FQJ7_HELPZ|nr:unnamed protein product [Heligmosomoides polygyrus]
MPQHRFLDILPRYLPFIVVPPLFLLHLAAACVQALFGNFFPAVFVYSLRATVYIKQMPHPRLTGEGLARRRQGQRESQQRRRAALPPDVREAIRAAEAARRRNIRRLANEARLEEARIQQQTPGSVPFPITAWVEFG